MHKCDFCGIEKETYDVVENHLLSNFAQITVAGPHLGKHICGPCYKKMLPVEIYSACYIQLADGEQEGFVMNHSFASEEPTYTVVARGLEFDGEMQAYVLLTDIPPALIRRREGEQIPEDLRKEWEMAIVENGAH